MKAVIMAGGRGTRIASIAGDRPKPMIEIAGMPVLEHGIRCLHRQGYDDMIITVGHLGEAIMDYFGDGSRVSPATGETFGVHIEYHNEREPMGNAGALFKLRERLDGDFLLLNGDLVFDVDLDRFVAYHKGHGKLATLFTHPNDHPYDSSLIIADKDGAVQGWIPKEGQRPLYYHNRVNAGLHVISPRLLDQDIGMARVDLDRHLLLPLAGTGEMYAYDSPEYVKDMGTPERYESVCRDFRNGRVQAKNLKNRQRAVFLDRDGTLNEHVGFLRDIDKLMLIPGTAAAVRQINMSGYLAVVATNQPVVARGEVTFGQLRGIHDRLETLLGREGAYLDAIYVCPHHPHKGYQGEIPGLKKECGCRKPKPGLLLQAAGDFNIDLGASWMVGDSGADIAAGRAAGCRTALIGRPDALYGQDATVRSLSDFVDRYLGSAGLERIG